MDYKKLHKETLEKLQQIVREGRMTEEVAKYICPDFVAESEDEKIRKVLVDMVKRETGFTGFPSQGQVLAYLERQKEQKPVISNEAIREGIAHFGITQYQIDNWLKKHINVVEQKSACSEKDEAVLDALIRRLEGEDIYVSLHLAVECLKSLKERVLHQQQECIEDSVKFEEGFKAGRESGLRDGQKYVLNNLDSYGLCESAEWSEEDEALIENVCTALKGYALHERKVDLDEHAHRLEEMSERLKSLLLQHHWKPSEEQMNELREALIPGHDFDCDVLASLYADLKKLMEE